MRDPIDTVDVPELHRQFTEDYGPQCPLPEFTMRLRNHLRLLRTMTSAPVKEAGPLHPRLNAVAEVCRRFYSGGYLRRLTSPITMASGKTLEFVRGGMTETMRCWGPEALGGVPKGAADVAKGDREYAEILKALAVAESGFKITPRDAMAVMPRTMLIRITHCPYIAVSSTGLLPATSGPGLPTADWWAYLNAFNQAATYWLFGEANGLYAATDGWHLAYVRSK